MYICIGIIFLLFYFCWQAITRVLPNQYANASVTITALLDLCVGGGCLKQGWYFIRAWVACFWHRSPKCALVYKHLCPILLLIAFKLITYGTARVKTSEHVNFCISLYTKNCLYHNFISILMKYFPNCFQISMSTRRLMQWLCEDISVGGGCLRQGYFAYSCRRRVLRVTSPIWQGAILHNHIYVTTL